MEDPDYTKQITVENPSQVTVHVWWDKRRVLIDTLRIAQNAVVETVPTENVE